MPKTVDLKAGEGIGNFVSDPWDMMRPNEKVVFHRD